MVRGKNLKNSLSLFGFASLLALSACSTTAVVEEKDALPVVPSYVKVPHPAGFDLADLKAIFLSPLAPRGALGEFADTCDDEFKKLLIMTPNREDIKKAALELVTQDPERMHWCFYSKISRLQDTLQTDATWSVRQKRVLESFEFLSPIANAFLDSFHDSRYFRWAAQYYSRISEWVFFKKLQPTAENTLLLTDRSRSDLEPWVQVQDPSQKRSQSVFAKYGISFQPSVAGAMNPFEDTNKTPGKPEVETRIPASVPVPAEAPKSAPVPSQDSGVIPFPEVKDLQTN